MRQLQPAHTPPCAQVPPTPPSHSSSDAPHSHTHTHTRTHTHTHVPTFRWHVAPEAVWHLAQGGGSRRVHARVRPRDASQDKPRAAQRRCAAACVLHVVCAVRWRVQAINVSLCQRESRCWRHQRCTPLVHAHASRGAAVGCARICMPRGGPAPHTLTLHARARLAAAAAAAAAAACRAGQLVHWVAGAALWPGGGHKRAHDAGGCAAVARARHWEPRARPPRAWLHWADMCGGACLRPRRGARLQVVNPYTGHALASAPPLPAEVRDLTWE
jgi:hypothetical protein